MKNALTNQIIDISRDIETDIIDFRRKIHENPELGYEEKETTKLIKENLKNLPLSFQEISETGVVAILEGKNSKKTLMIRADIDALPIEEDTGLEFSSKNKNVMHACGHDGHTSILYGAIRILSELKDEIDGNIKFLFQPAEEAPNGAVNMVKSGVLENPKVDAVIGTHIWPDIESGKYGVRNGAVMSAPDFFKIKIIGKGGHGSQPEKCIDPIMVSNEIYNAFQKIPTHIAGVLDPTVVSVTKFIAGTTNNAIPSESIMEGTCRSYNNDLHEKLPGILEEIVSSVTKRYGAEYEFSYRGNCPAVINDSKMENLALNSISNLFGKSAVADTPYPAMTGDDFSLFSSKVPGVYFWSGTKTNSLEGKYPLHHPKFTLDEKILAPTAALIAQMAIDYFNE